MVPGSVGSSLSLFSSFPGPSGPWRLLRGQMKGTHRADPASFGLPPEPPTHCHQPTVVSGSVQPAEGLIPHSEAGPASTLILFSRLSCVLALGFGVSTSASLCLCLCPCSCLSPSSLLLLAPVDIKVIKDLPWPPPVGQLDSSPSLPDGDRDISGPASPLPEPSLEDCSGGFRGGFWPG